jgi:hypothetical protein
MVTNKLYMVLLGCKPTGRHIEQHDLYFGIASHLPALVPAMEDFWTEARGKLHVDVWREVTHVDGYQINVCTNDIPHEESPLKLFFVNLGGYKEQQFDEFHYKQLVVAEGIAEAIAAAKKSAFWKHHISSHIDDKYGLDVDDIYNVEDLLDDGLKAKYYLSISKVAAPEEDELHIGYLQFSKLQKGKY